MGEPTTQVFRSSSEGKITDWDEVAGGRGKTREQALAELTQRPVDDDGIYIMSPRDELERAETKAQIKADRRMDAEAEHWVCGDCGDGITPGAEAELNRVHLNDGTPMCQNRNDAIERKPGHFCCPDCEGEPAALPVQVRRDGKVMAEVEDSNAAFAWLLRHQSFSTDWAIKYEGWSVTDASGTELPEYRKD
jgi:hypothetical protein